MNPRNMLKTLERGAAILFLPLALAGCGGGSKEVATAEVIRAPLEVWHPLDGKIESRTVRMLMSRLGGSAALVEMAPEGSRVLKDDVVARFDSSKTERDLVKLEADFTLAKSEYESLVNAQLPLQLRELEMQIAEAGSVYEAERQYLEDSRVLVKEELVSEQEIRQQEAKVLQQKTKLEHLQTQLGLTRQHLHPLAQESAKARLAAAEQALVFARQEAKDCVLRAPADGLVVYLRVHVGGEYRTAQVGDSIYRNQPFMAIPDMTNLLVHAYVPESDLAKVAPGSRAVITPLAYPGLVLEGVVESVGTMAQAMMEKPSWQKFFHITISLQSVDERLRSGMSVNASVLSFFVPEAVLIPRPAVFWEEGKPFARVVRKTGMAEKRALRLGQGNSSQFEVLEGVQPGERVEME